MCLFSSHIYHLTTPKSASPSPLQLDRQVNKSATNTLGRCKIRYKIILKYTQKK